MRTRRLAAGLGLTLLFVPVGPSVAAEAVTPRGRDFEIRRDTLAMPDGVRLSVTYFLPKAKTPAERFPVLLELLPYRKDDSFYLRDYPPHVYWARRGFASAKVDIRGTGSSEGRVPDREYSEPELDDAVVIIDQLSKLPFSNGSVGMWGISWSGFNAIQVAMRQPPALKAILALHSADNVYRDSVDLLDGAFHLDSYHLQIHHENGLPQPPDYALDEAYFRDRFDVKPWFFSYVRNQRDGAFWRKSALITDYSKLKVPAYLIGGLSTVTATRCPASSRMRACRSRPNWGPGTMRGRTTGSPARTTNGAGRPYASGTAGCAGRKTASPRASASPCSCGILTPPTTN